MFNDKQATFFVLGYLLSVWVGGLIDWIDGNLGVGLMGVLAIIIAVLKYIYEKEKDRKTQAIDLISFFRKEVLKQSEELSSLLRKNNHEPVRMRLDARNYSEACSKYPEEMKKQVDVLSGQETLDLTVNLANLLEDFSARVITLSAKNEVSLRILHDSFIKLSETVSSFIFYDRRESGNLNFTNTIELYDSWNKYS